MPSNRLNFDTATPSARILESLRQFLLTMPMHVEGWHFIRDNKPYKGLPAYGPFFWFLVGLGMLVGWHFFAGTFQVFTQAVTDQEALGSTMASFFGDFSWDKLQNSLTGGRKYLVMIALEVIVFHFIQRTLEFRTGRKPDYSLKAFVGAEVRVFQVALIAWALETVAIFLSKLAIGIAGLHFLERPAGFLIQCYFLGWALVDNYNECFGLRVGESEKRTRRMAMGVALATGLVAYLLMYLPVVGVVISTMLGAVTATLAMERFAPVTEEELAYYELVRNTKKHRSKKQAREGE